MKTIASLLMIITFCSAYCIAEEPIPVPISELGKKYELTGKLHVPLGKVTTIKGIVTYKGIKLTGGCYLIVQEINGQATQKEITIHIEHFYSDWTKSKSTEIVMPIKGLTYEMTGYETCFFYGVPADVFEKYKNNMRVQLSKTLIHEKFMVMEYKEIQPIDSSPDRNP